MFNQRKRPEEKQQTHRETMIRNQVSLEDGRVFGTSIVSREENKKSKSLERPQTS